MYYCLSHDKLVQMENFLDRDWYRSIRVLVCATYTKVLRLNLSLCAHSEVHGREAALGSSKYQLLGSGGGTVGDHGSALMYRAVFEREWSLPSKALALHTGTGQ